MATIKAAIRRGLLQYLYDGVVLGTIADDLGLQGVTVETLEKALMWYQRFVFTDIQSGKISAGSSGMGHQVQWAAMQPWRAYDPPALFEAVQEMREIYADALVTLSANGVDPATDKQVLDVMLADDRMQTVTRTQTDFTAIRLPWVRFS